MLFSTASYIIPVNTKQLYDFMQCWTNVEDVGPTLYKYYTNVLCLLGNILKPSMWYGAVWQHKFRGLIKIFHQDESSLLFDCVVCTLDLLRMAYLFQGLSHNLFNRLTAGAAYTRVFSFY